MKPNDSMMKPNDSMMKPNDSSQMLQAAVLLLSIETQVYEKWSDDLLNVSSDYFQRLSQIYIEEFAKFLENIKKKESELESNSLSSLSLSWEVYFSMIQVISFTKATNTITGKRRRQNGEAAVEEFPSEINVELQAIFEVLADADDENKSGLTIDAEKILMQSLENAVKDQTAAMTEGKLTNSTNFVEGGTNFLTEVKVNGLEYKAASSNTTISTISTVTPTISTTPSQICHCYAQDELIESKNDHCVMDLGLEPDVTGNWTFTFEAQFKSWPLKNDTFTQIISGIGEIDLRQEQIECLKNTFNLSFRTD